MLYSCYKERDLTKCNSVHVSEHGLPIYKKTTMYLHYKICWHWCSICVRVSPNKIGHTPLQLHTSSDLVTYITLLKQILLKNKTNKCIWKYMNLWLHKRCKPSKCFGFLSWPSSGRYFYKGHTTETTKPMYKSKILSFIYVFHSVC